MPNNWKQKSVRMIDSNWKLNEERTIIYVQNNKHKMNVIFEKLSKGLYAEELPKVSEMRDAFMFQFKYNENDFMNWFKNKYSKIYLELF